MNIFISQPMNGKTMEEINDVRVEIISKLEKKLGVSYEDMYVVNDFDYGNDMPSRLVMLGRSIEAMADADVIVFAEGFSAANGCVVEHQVVLSYISTDEFENKRIYFERRGNLAKARNKKDVFAGYDYDANRYTPCDSIESFIKADSVPKTECRKLSNEFDRLNKYNDELEHKVSTLFHAIDGLYNDIVLHQNSLDHTRDLIDGMNDTLDEPIETSSGMILSIRQELLALIRETSIDKDHIQNLEYDLDNLRKDYDILAKDYETLDNAHKGLLKEHDHVCKVKEARIRENKNLTNDLANARSDFKDLSGLYRTLKNDYDILDNAHRGLLKEYDRLCKVGCDPCADSWLLTENRKLKDCNDSLQNELILLREKYDNMESDYNRLKDIYESNITAYNRIFEERNKYRDECLKLQEKTKNLCYKAGFYKRQANSIYGLGGKLFEFKNRDYTHTDIYTKMIGYGGWSIPPYTRFDKMVIQADNGLYVSDIKYKESVKSYDVRATDRNISGVSYCTDIREAKIYTVWYAAMMDRKNLRKMYGGNNGHYFTIKEFTF